MNRLIFGVLCLIGFGSVFGADVADIKTQLLGTQSRIQTLQCVVTTTVTSPLTGVPTVETYRLFQTPTHKRMVFQTQSRRELIITPTASIQIDGQTITHVTSSPTVDPPLLRELPASYPSIPSVNWAALSVDSETPTQWRLSGQLYGLTVRLVVSKSPVAWVEIDLTHPNTGLSVNTQQTVQVIDDIPVPSRIDTVIQTQAGGAPIRSRTQYRGVVLNQPISASVFEHP